jgi:hypothetical protein
VYIKAICPAGPPKLIKPSFSQYQKAAAKVTGEGGSSLIVVVMCKASGKSVVDNVNGNRGRTTKKGANAPFYRQNRKALPYAYRRAFTPLAARFDLDQRFG